VGGGLTLRVTEKFAMEAMNLLAQPVRVGAQQEARPQPSGKAPDKDALRGYVEHLVDGKTRGSEKANSAQDSSAAWWTGCGCEA
jgi:hypothetical protein